MTTSKKDRKFQDIVDLAKKTSKGKLFSEMSGNEIFVPLDRIFDLNNQLNSYIIKKFVSSIKDIDLCDLPDTIDKCCDVIDTFTKEEIEQRSKRMYFEVTLYIFLTGETLHSLKRLLKEDLSEHYRSLILGLITKKECIG